MLSSLGARLDYGTFVGGTAYAVMGVVFLTTAFSLRWDGLRSGRPGRGEGDDIVSEAALIALWIAVVAAWVATVAVVGQQDI